jgi:uncharacterized protein YxeA
MKSLVASATNAVIICITIFIFHIFVSVSQYETHTSDKNTCYLQGKQMCEKLTDHKTTVDVGMLNSCFHLAPASQDGDILEVNLCRPHYQKLTDRIKTVTVKIVRVYIAIFHLIKL